jgi:hypothetical protein
MNYNDALELIRINPFYLGLIPVELIDIRMMRYVRKFNIWAADAYCPKKLKQYWLNITLDEIIPRINGLYIDPITNQPFEDIL